MDCRALSRGTQAGLWRGLFRRGRRRGTVSNRSRDRHASRARRGASDQSDPRSSRIRTRAASLRRRAHQAGPDSQNVERQNSAARLPPKVLGRHAQPGRRMARKHFGRERRAGRNDSDVERQGSDVERGRCSIVAGVASGREARPWFRRRRRESTARAIRPGLFDGCRACALGRNKSGRRLADGQLLARVKHRPTRRASSVAVGRTPPNTNSSARRARKRNRVPTLLRPAGPVVLAQPRAGECGLQHSAGGESSRRARRCRSAARPLRARRASRDLADDLRRFAWATRSASP